MLKLVKSKTNGNDGIERPTRQQIIDALEIRAEKRLGMSAKQMFRAYNKGKLDPSEIMDLLIASSLLPDNDPIFG